MFVFFLENFLSSFFLIIFSDAFDIFIPLPQPLLMFNSTVIFMFWKSEHNLSTVSILSSEMMPVNFLLN